MSRDRLNAPVCSKVSAYRDAIQRLKIYNETYDDKMLYQGLVLYAYYKRLGGDKKINIPDNLIPVIKMTNLKIDLLDIHIGKKVSPCDALIRFAGKFNGVEERINLPTRALLVNNLNGAYGLRLVTLGGSDRLAIFPLQSLLSYKYRQIVTTLSEQFIIDCCDCYGYDKVCLLDAVKHIV